MKTSSAMGAMAPAHPMMHHSMAMSMPADASAGAYLHIAKMAIRHDNKAVADDALSRAETRLLTREVPQGSSIPTDDSPAVTAIEHARADLGTGNMMQAAVDTQTAMGQVGQSSAQ